MLHLTKVAVGCDTLGSLSERQAARTVDWNGLPAVPVYTGTVPRLADDLTGGSLYWIVRHVLVARQAIVGTEPISGDPRWRLKFWLDPAIVPVTPVPCRAHQGWRYLRAEHAPPDGQGAVPGDVLADLSALGLL